MNDGRTDGYGGWRQARSMGLGGMDTRQTVIVVASIMIPLFSFVAVGPASGLAAAIPAAVMLLLAITRRGGVVVLDLVVARLRWQHAHWRGETSYRGQVLTEFPQAWDLPGVLAPCRLMAVHEPGRGEVGVLWNQRTGRMSATLLLSPAGALLTDLSTINAHVTAWGNLLASLADTPEICHAAVTIELVPEAGTRLADHVQARIAPDAPKLAKDVLTQLVAAAPRGASRVRARLTLTVDPAAGRKPRSAVDSAAEVVRMLGGLSISAAGADVVRRATPSDLVRAVRTAFDPTAEAAPASAWDLDWADAGPIAAEEHLDHYEHDGAYSTSWVLLAAPRQRVAYDVLFPLCRPGAWTRRVTVMYRTLDRDVAGAVLEREANVAAAREYARQRSHRDPTAREKADQARALRAARQEAHGAGLVQFALYVTTTTARHADLDQARREVERAAGDSKLKLRIARGGQAACFAAGLPAGVYPPDA